MVIFLRCNFHLHCSLLNLLLSFNNGLNCTVRVSSTNMHIIAGGLLQMQHRDIWEPLLLCCK